MFKALKELSDRIYNCNTKLVFCSETLIKAAGMFDRIEKVLDESVGVVKGLVNSASKLESLLDVQKQISKATEPVRTLETKLAERDVEIARLKKLLDGDKGALLSEVETLRSSLNYFKGLVEWLEKRTQVSKDDYDRYRGGYRY